jgi:hypothetical protein
MYKEKGLIWPTILVSGNSKQYGTSGQSHPDCIMVWQKRGRSGHVQKRPSTGGVDWSYDSPLSK